MDMAADALASVALAIVAVASALALASSFVDNIHDGDIRDDRLAGTVDSGNTAVADASSHKGVAVLALSSEACSLVQADNEPYGAKIPFEAYAAHETTPSSPNRSLDKMAVCPFPFRDKSVILPNRILDSTPSCQSPAVLFPSVQAVLAASAWMAIQVLVMATVVSSLDGVPSGSSLRQKSASIHKESASASA